MTRPSLLALTLLTLTGCATMAGRGPERITIDSIPSGADVAIDCPSGPKSTGVTPASIPIPRSTGDCSVVVSKAGFKSSQLTLEQGFNRRYWLNTVPMLAAVVVAFTSNVPSTAEGAIALATIGAAGGAGLILDSITKAKYDHDPRAISVTLEPEPTPAPR